MKPSRNLLLGSLVVIAFGAAPSAHAASAVWDGSQNTGTWSDTANWTPVTSPGTGDTATFSGAGGTLDVIDLGAGVTINSILFDTSSVAAYTLGSGAVNSQTLTLNNGGAITANSTINANQIFNAALVLGTDATAQTYTITNSDASNSLTFAGTITGGSTGTAGIKTLNVSTAAGNVTLSGAITAGGATAIALTKSGSGTLILSGNNTYSGGTTLSAGTLNLSTSNTALGTGTLTVSGNSTLGTANGSSALNLANAVSVSASQTLTLNTGYANLTLSGNITNSGTITTVGGGNNITTSYNILSGTNSDSGKFIIGDGNGTSHGHTIQFAKTASLYNGNTGSWTAANIIVKNGGALSLNVGALTNEFTTGNVTTLLTNLGGLGGAVSSNGFLSGSSIGFDTTNASGGTFTVADNIANSTGTGGGAIGLFKYGTNTLVLSGANAFTGATKVLAGTLKLGSTGALGNTTNKTSGVTVSSGAALDLAGFTPTASAVPLTLNGTGISSGGGLTNSNAATATYGGLLTLGSASSIEAATGNITLSNAGTITGSGFGLTVGGAKDTTINSIIGTGAGTLTKQDAGILTLGANNTYTGNTILDGGTVRYTVDNTGVKGLFFGATNGSTNVSTLDMSTTPSNLTATSLTVQTLSASANNINIGANKTLTVNGNVTVNTTGINGTQGASLTFNSGGAVSTSTFTVTGANTFLIGQDSATGTTTRTGTVDMRNLGTFNAGTSGTALASFILGKYTQAQGSNYGDGGKYNLYLAPSSTIYSTALSVGDNSSGAPGHFDNTLYLGSGTTALHATTFTVGETGAISAGSTIKWNTGVTAGSLTLNGTGATSAVTDMFVGYKTDTASNSAGTRLGTVDLSNGTVAGSITNLYLGYKPGTGDSGTSPATTTGVFKLGAGATGASSSLTIDNLTLGLSNSATSSRDNPVNGTFQLDGGTVSVTNNVALTNESLYDTRTGILTINGGVMMIGGNITSGITKATSTLTLSGGTLDMTGGLIGTLANPIDTFTINPATAAELKNVSTINGTAGITKTGAGALTLNANNYTGVTAINAGSALINGSDDLGDNSATNTISLNTGTLRSTANSYDLGLNRNITLAGAGTIQSDADTLTVSGGVTNGANLLTVTGAGNTTISGVVGNGAGGLTKTGNGTLTLSNANTYTGTTTISAGMLLLGGGNGTTTGTLATTTAGGVVNNATLQLQANATNTSGGISTALTGTGTANQVLTTSGTSSTIQLRGDSNVTFFAGSSGNGFMGGVNNVAGYTLNFDINQLTGAGSNNAFTFGSTTNGLQIGRNVQVNVTGGNGDSLVIGPVSYVSTIGTLTLNPTTANLTMGGFKNSQTTAATLTLGGTSSGNIVNGTIANSTGTGTPATVLNKQNTSTWTLSAANTFTGVTTITGGTLKLGHATAITTSPTINISGGGTLDIAGYTTTTTGTVSITGTGVGGNGVIVNSGADQTGAFHAISLAGNATIGGTGRMDIRSGTAPSLALNNNTLTIAMTGAGTNAFSLVGTAVTPGTGSINVTNGTFSIQTTTNMGGSAANSVNVSNGAILDFYQSPTDIWTHNMANGSTIKCSATGAIAGPFALTGTVTADLVQNLTLNGIVSGSGATLTKTGNGTLTLSNTNTYSGGTTISAGTLSVGATANLGDAAANLVFDGGTLQITGTGLTSFSGIGHTVSFNATKTVGLDINNAGNTFTVDQVMNQTSGGFTKLGAGMAVLSQTNTYSGTTTISAGTLQIGNASTTGTLGTGAVANAGTLAFNRTNTYTLGSGNLVTGAGTVRLNSGTIAAAVDNQFNTTGSLTIGASAGATTVANLDLTNGSSTFGSMLVQTDSASVNTLTIGTGKTLRINGAVTVGYNSAATSATKLSATGLGTLSIGNSGTPTNANVQIGNGATSNVSNGATLDMSGLSTFYANLGTGTFRVGDPTNSSGTGTAGSTLILAANSTIQAATLTTESPSGAVTEAIKLGSGTNILNVNTLNVGAFNAGRSNGTLTFNTGTGTLIVRSQTDPVNGRATLNVGNVSFSTGISQTGNVFDTTGHSADLYFGTMTIGSRTANNGTTAGTFSFDTGTLDSNALVAGKRGAGATGTATTSGIVNLGGGTAVFNSTAGPVQLGTNESTTTGSTASGTLNISGGSVTVAANTGNSFRLGHSSVAGGTASGTINLTGGTLTVAGDIIRGDATGTSEATLNLDGGTLDMGGNEIGGSVVASNLTSLTFASGTLKNVSEINNGGALTKTTSGTLTLSGANTYTGTTQVSAGTLVIGSAGSIANSSQIIVGANTTFDVSAVSFTLGETDAQTLSGTGSITGNMSIGSHGTLAIGSSPGTMTFANDLGLNADSISNFEINGFGTGYYDLALAATAGIQTVSFNGGILNLFFQAGFNTEGTVKIFDFDTYAGTGFTSFTTTGLADGFTASFDATNGFVTVIPEPRAALLGGLGLLALLRRRRA